MEGSYFPEDKDLAHKIMMDLDNSELVKLCATNKRMYEVCNNYPTFWRNKFIKDYGEHAAQYKPENRSWKNHYMTVFIDLQKYQKNPMEFLYNIFWKSNIDDSYFMDYENQQFVPLKQAPEWVTNNLYLLNIDKIKTYMDEGLREYKNIKPIEIFQIFQKQSGGLYLRLVKHSSNIWTADLSSSVRIYLDSKLPGPQPN
jgi:hypothetical protein